jgi:hypothetical protein
MASTNEQPTHASLPQRLFLALLAHSPLDMDHCHVEHRPPIRYALLFGGLLVVSFLTIPVADALWSDQGMAAPVLLEASSPVLAAVALLVLVLVYQVIAGVLARHLNPAIALFVIGVGFSILSLSMGGIRQFAWSEGSPWILGIETLAWSVVTFYIAWALQRSSGGLPDVPHDWKTEPIGSWSALSSKPSLISLACGGLVLPFAWLLLADTSSGQVLGAVIVGGFLAGMAGRVAAPKLDPILIYPAVVLAGGIAQLVAASGWSGDLSDGLVLQSIPRVLSVMPITWVAGSLAGVSMGIGWARSFVDNGLVADHDS